MMRRIKVTGQRVLPSLGENKQRMAQERYMIGLVANNPHRAVVLSSLKEGIGPSEIASYFASNGWIEVNERTFTEAIRVYRRKNPKAIEETTVEGIDEYVDGNLPSLDVESQLQQLLRMQKIRLGIAVKNEKQFGVLMGGTYKEVAEATKILETLAKVNGRLNTPGAHSGEGLSAEVSEDLSTIKKEEGVADRLHGLVKQLATGR